MKTALEKLGTVKKWPDVIALIVNFLNETAIFVDVKKMEANGAPCVP